MSAIDKILKKIKWSRILHDNGAIISYISELTQSFEKKIEKFQPEDKLFDLVKSALIEISESCNTDYALYKKLTNEKYLWQNTIDNKEWYLKESNNSLSEIDGVVFSKRFNKKEKSSDYNRNSEFVVASIPNEDVFMIELQNSKSDKLFYFKSELENLVKNYLQLKEIHDLKEEKKNNEIKYQESEKKVISANKEKRRKVYELHNLVEASNDIYSILDFKQLINSSLLTIIGQVGFQKAFVLLYDNKTKVFSQIHHKGFVDAKFDNLHFNLTSPIVPYFFKNRTPVDLTRLERIEKNGDFDCRPHDLFRKTSRNYWSR